MTVASSTKAYRNLMLFVIRVTTRRTRRREPSWLILICSAKRAGSQRRYSMPISPKRHRPSPSFPNAQRSSLKRKPNPCLLTTANATELNCQAHAAHVPTHMLRSTRPPTPRSVSSASTTSSALWSINPSKPNNPHNNEQINAKFRAKSTFLNDFGANPCIYEKKTVTLQPKVAKTSK